MSWQMRFVVASNSTDAHPARPIQSSRRRFRPAGGASASGMLASVAAASTGVNDTVGRFGARSGSASRGRGLPVAAASRARANAVT